MNKPRKISFTKWCARYLMNINLLVIVGVLIYILFFTQNSVQETYNYEQQIIALKEKLQQEKDSLQYYKTLNHRLTGDPYILEQQAREHYYMQRPNEDVFIIK